MMLTIRAHLWRFLPAFFLIGIMWLLWKALYIKNIPEDQISSKPFPSFSLNDVRHEEKAVTLADLQGQVSIVHVWASWCDVCVREHQEWLNIINQWPYPLVGMVYRDDANTVKTILAEKGDPFTLLLNDRTGQLGVDLGIVGTPETFIVDANGVIRYHHLGAIDQAYFESELLPVLKQLNGNDVG